MHLTTDWNKNIQTDISTSNSAQHRAPECDIIIWTQNRRHSEIMDDDDPQLNERRKHLVKFKTHWCVKTTLIHLNCLNPPKFLCYYVYNVI